MRKKKMMGEAKVATTDIPSWRRNKLWCHEEDSFLVRTLISRSVGNDNAKTSKSFEVPRWGANSKYQFEETKKT
jgi:hypothetical protein